MEEQLEAGNAALFRATCGKTRLAYVRGGGSQTLQAAREAGFRCTRYMWMRSEILRSSSTTRILRPMAGPPMLSKSFFCLFSDLIHMYLVKEGFDVRTAGDGGRAIEEFQKATPDLILLDIMLPVMDGCRW